MSIATQSLTLDEFLKLPETTPTSEFINGKIFQKPMPQREHSRLQAKLGAAINTALNWGGSSTQMKKPS
ncbi:Uma2 family endonuclease [Leptolyngbya sp. PCC 6406]|uniref:Uma2 family endonuclease n=1 Tax=Leptolyngbya sp. PCC 6406 TaxID=1173264 RepID=UPI0002ACE577|nr:Uma2 family endonuclease [Leptolyngbya sp. PCC 6406]